MEPVYPVPFCMQCKCDMRCFANDVFLADEEEAQDTPTIWGRAGDVFICPECGVQVITGLSKAHYRDRGALEMSKQAVVRRAYSV